MKLTSRWIAPTLLIAVAAGTLSAAPAWWTDAVTSIFDGAYQNTHNYTPINIGQLKNVASKAKLYLDMEVGVFGGAGPYINEMVRFSNSGNYSPANFGQVKNITQPYYDRLALLKYNWQTPTDTTNSASQPYRWTATTGAENATPVPLGLLKKFFEFELLPAHLADADGDRLPDLWEEALYPADASFWQDPALDTDGDGVTNYVEMLLGTNPLSSGSTPVDANGDGIFDAVAAVSGFAVLTTDPDNDGWSTSVERQRGTNPWVADTDGDGLMDSMDLAPLYAGNTTWTVPLSDTVAPLITRLRP